MKELKKSAIKSTDSKPSVQATAPSVKKVTPKPAAKKTPKTVPAIAPKTTASKTPPAKRVSPTKKTAVKSPVKKPSAKLTPPAKKAAGKTPPAKPATAAKKAAPKLPLKTKPKISDVPPAPAQLNKVPAAARPKAPESAPAVNPPHVVVTSVVPKASEEIAQSKPSPRLASVPPILSTPATKPLQPPFVPPTLPPFLFEDDQPAPVPQRGPGYRYALIPQGVTPASNFDLPSLPESYGTGRIHLTARDPEWLHADWDLSAAQLTAANSASSTGHLSLRVRRIDGKEAGNVTDIALLPDSRHWFIHIGEDNCECQVSLGYATKKGNWVEMATSKQVTTPRRGVTHDFKSLFITKEVAPLREMPLLVAVETTEVCQLSPSEPAVDSNFSTPSFAPAESPTSNDLPAPLIVDTTIPHRDPPRSALDNLLDTWWEQALADGSASLAGLLAAPGWSPAQAEALASLLRIDEEQRVWLGSMELTRELMARHAESNLETASSIQLSEHNAAVMAESSPSNSPSGGRSDRSFWFKVNAELVIYGSVASGAQVWIGSRPLHLRPDNTFSQRFILPDGNYTLPVEAESADGVETRFATLHFVRNSEYGGVVHPHPQDLALKPPKVENVESAN